jgi:hypothetical protein
VGDTAAEDEDRGPSGRTPLDQGAQAGVVPLTEHIRLPSKIECARRKVRRVELSVDCRRIGPDQALTFGVVRLLGV